MSFRFRTFVPAILALFAASAAVRWARREEPIVTNIDAPYHVLLTVQAMNETPASIHHFLPIVTLGRPMDRDVPFGSTLRGPLGIYYYTSFPPLGFVAPWAFFRLTGLAPNIEHLLVFNLALHLGATLLLALFVSELATAVGVEPFTHGALVLLAAATYLFTFEALYAHGIIYWHHSLFQVAWLTQLVAAARVLRAADDGSALRRRDVAVLFVASVLAPAIEWTGYLTSALVAARSYSRGVVAGRGDIRRLGAWLLLCPLVAGIAFVIHFASVLGIAPLIDALTSRAQSRSGDFGQIHRLANAYVDSFGALLILVPVLVALYAAKVRRLPASWLLSVIVLTVVPLGENLALAQHATSYHFDRLKALIPIVTVSAMAIALLPRRQRFPALLLWVAVVCWNLKDLQRTRSIDSSPPLVANSGLMRQVRAVAKPCALYIVNVQARGWVDLALNASAYENILTVDSAASLVRARGACQGIYFKAGYHEGEDMYVWRNATIIDPGSSSRTTIDAVVSNR
jgi:hypothetical protein